MTQILTKTGAPDVSSNGRIGVNGPFVRRLERGCSFRKSAFVSSGTGEVMDSDGNLETFGPFRHLQEARAELM